ncbi:MAG TPA: hypothetical protein VHM90_18085, partial [Phycisphaerae bacterium]|nr:hypothetical protein [Phycisphaerae bacterium]
VSLTVPARVEDLAQRPEDFSGTRTAKPTNPHGSTRRRTRDPLVKPAAVKHEKRKLRAIRNDLKVRPTTEDTDIRDTLL